MIIEPNRNNPLMFIFSMLVREDRKALRFSEGYLEKIISSCSMGAIVPNKTPMKLLSLFFKIRLSPLIFRSHFQTFLLRRNREGEL